MGEPLLRREDEVRNRDEEEEEGLIADPLSRFGTTDIKRDGSAAVGLSSTAPSLDHSDATTTHRPVNSGGVAVYIPPAKRRQMLLVKQKKLALTYNENNNTNSSSTAIQEQTWNDQKRVIHGTINRLNESTVKPLIHDLFSKVNLLRLRGILVKHLLQAALTSTQYSAVYAALIAVLNTKLPEVGELVLKRAILAFRRHYRRKEKPQCLAMAIFMGHLFHQAVVHELLILQILTLLLDGDPTDDSVEVAVEFLTIVGQALLEVSPAGVRAVLDRLRSLLHEGHLQKRVEYKMEVLLKMRKTGFRDCPLPVPKELDLVERDDQITFELSLDDEDLSKEDNLDVFRADDDYQENEETWAKIRAEILGLNGGSDDEGDEATDDEGDGDVEEEDIEDQELVIVPPTFKAITTIQDLTETDLVHLRRQIYLTIMSSATFEECTHKLTKISIPTGRESELINMIIECCSQERTFLRYYGLIGARFCLLDNRWLDAFLEAFEAQYTTIHRLETNKLRNVAKLFAHLLHTDAMPWKCFSIIHLNEDETTSSSRIFVKILIQEMAEAMGIARLKERFETTHPELSDWYTGMFPRDDVRKTRYAINFFTSIGLGPLTDGLREFLKNAPKMILAQAAAAAAQKSKDDDLSVSSSSSSSSSDSSSLSSSSSYTSSSSYDSSSSSSSSSASSRSSYSRERRHSRRSRRKSPSSSSTYSSDGIDSYDRNKSMDRSKQKYNDRSNRRSSARDSRRSDGSDSIDRKKPKDMARHSDRVEPVSRSPVSDNHAAGERSDSRGRDKPNDRNKLKNSDRLNHASRSPARSNCGSDGRGDDNGRSKPNARVEKSTQVKPVSRSPINDNHESGERRDSYDADESNDRIKKKNNDRLKLASRSPARGEYSSDGSGAYHRKKIRDRSSARGNRRSDGSDPYDRIKSNDKGEKNDQAKPAPRSSVNDSSSSDERRFPSDLDKTKNRKNMKSKDRLKSLSQSHASDSHSFDGDDPYGRKKTKDRSKQKSNDRSSRTSRTPARDIHSSDGSDFDDRIKPKDRTKKGDQVIPVSRSPVSKNHSSDGSDSYDRNKMRDRTKLKNSDLSKRVSRLPARDNHSSAGSDSYDRKKPKDTTKNSERTKPASRQRRASIDKRRRSSSSSASSSDSPKRRRV